MAGSGKTWLGKQIAKESMPNAVSFSDVTQTTSDDRRRAGHGTLGEMVARLLGASEDCVMDEAHLTVPSFRDDFKSFCDRFLVGVQQDWIFFEADVVACINNVFHDFHAKGRNRLSRLTALESQRQVYQVPSEEDWPGRRVQPVYNREDAQFEASNERGAVRWLRSEIARQSRFRWFGAGRD